MIIHTQLRGTIATGSVGEIFSHSLGIESSAPLATVATAVRDAWQAAFIANSPNSLQAFTASEVVYEEATAAQVLDPMVPDLSAAVHAPFAGGLAGTAVQAMLPSQNALAVSLTAGVRPNGAPLRGRFYLPPLSVQATGQDGLVNSAQQNIVLTAITQFINTLFGQQHWPTVWSRTVEDLANPVDLIRVGNRMDTIRSRRNALPETYVSQVPVGPQ